MLNIVLEDFLHSLCTWMVGSAAAFTPPVAIAYAAAPRTLTRTIAKEEPGGANVTDPYAVLRIYGGPPFEQWHPLCRQDVQCQAVSSEGKGDEAGLALVWTLFQTLLDATGKPIRMATISGFKAADNSTDGTYLVHHVDPKQRPGFTGRDERGRALATFNFEVGFCRTS